ncbi:MAG: SDR family oxidoreductase [Hyphomonadaceae bacterium]|nr:SDR family oxidoreductase [Hyphomonadaceae bacterium]
MDLGLRGKNAIVMASSKGLGFACANALAREGANVAINGRGEEAVKAAAASIKKNHDVNVIEIVADLTTDNGREALLAAFSEPDILILNGGGPPPTPFGKTDEAAWEKTLHDTLTSPLLMVQGVLDGMRARKFGRIVAITSAMVKTPHPVMVLSHAPRTGLTSVLKSISRETVKDNVTINQLLPERFETDRHRFLAQATADAKGISLEEVNAAIKTGLAAGRLGQPEEFGDACAYLCAAQSGYICGQNLMLDGGNYRGQA